MTSKHSFLPYFEIGYPQKMIGIRLESVKSENIIKIYLAQNRGKKTNGYISLYNYNINDLMLISLYSVLNLPEQHKHS